MILRKIEKIKHDPYTRRIFNIFKTVFLVGGYIRDTLLSKAVVDRDYAVNIDPLRAAQKVQKIFPGKIIQFRDNLTVRIALKNGGNLDFTRLHGTIEQDLVKRDFTINAMAYHHTKGLIDPWGGKQDLRKKYIRATRPENLINDPIRMLRAFRFNSELGWEVERKTMQIIRDNCGLISQTSLERITFEFIQLMNGKSFIEALRHAQISGLLKKILSCNNNRLSININNIVKINDFINTSHYKKILNEEVSQRLRKKSMILLTALLNNVNISSSLLIINNNCIDFIGFTQKYLGYRRKGILAKREFQLFESMKDHHIELGIYSMDGNLLKKIDRYLKVRGKPLLDGHEVANITGFSGKQLGRTIKILKMKRYAGDIRNKREATSFMRSLAK